MPAAAPLIAAAVVNAGAAYFIVGVTLLAAAKIFFATFALGLIQQAFAGRQKPGKAALAPRTVTVRDARAPRRLVIGRAILGGTLQYAATTDNDHQLHLIVTFCDGPVDGFGTIWLEGEAVPAEAIGADGLVQDGRFSGVARIRFHTGTAPQPADAELVAEVEEWTAAHRLDGIAYVYLRLERDDKAFPNGPPNVKVETYGAAWQDPRDSVTRWTPNAAVAQAGWLANAAWGMGAPASEIDSATAQASANVCDEFVPVAQASDPFEARLAAGWLSRETTNIDGAGTGRGFFFGRTSVTFTSTGTLPAPLAPGTKYWIDARATPLHFRLLDTPDGNEIVLLDQGTGVHIMRNSVTRETKDGLVTKVTTDVVTAALAADRLWRTDTAIAWQLGDRVTCATDGTLPPPLAAATDYYVIPTAPPGFRLAASLALARARTPIAIAGLGSGAHTVTREAQPRYTCNGVISADTERGDVFDALLQASAARPVWTGGQWRIGAGAAGSSQAALAEGDLLGPIRTRTRVPRSERFNAIGGGMYDSMTGELVDYPPLESAAFKAADNGDRLYRPFNQTFTDSPGQAQRLAKIELLRARQEIAVDLTAGMAALPVVADEWFDLTHARWGWSGKEFQCELWQLVASEQDGAPLLTVRLSGHEIAASVYDWNSSEEQAVDPAPDTDLPNPFDLAAPSGLMVTEELYETRGAAGVKSRAILTWAAPASGFTDLGGSYRIQTRYELEEEWTPRGTVDMEQFILDDAKPGNWEFSVQSVSRLGGASPYSAPYGKELLGLLAPPANVGGPTIQTISALAILTWDRHPDLDVRIGGRIRVRWSPATTGATWAGAVEATDPVPGDATQAVAPLREGSYLLRAYDSSGVPSAGAAVISTRAAEHLDFTTLSTVTESPSFPGSHTNTVALDGVLKLAGSGLFDAIPDFDAVADLDSYGGISAAGTYDFDGGIDLGSVKTVRLTASVTAQAKNTLDLIDDRPAPVDDWEDWDGVLAAEADLQVWFQETDDDPAASPAWGDWRRLTAGDRNARGVQFQARLSSDDAAYNIEATALSVTAEEVV